MPVLPARGRCLVTHRFRSSGFLSPEIVVAVFFGPAVDIELMRALLEHEGHDAENEDTCHEQHGYAFARAEQKGKKRVHLMPSRLLTSEKTHTSIYLPVHSHDANLNCTSVQYSGGRVPTGGIMLDIKYVRENPDAIDIAMAHRQTSWDREKFFELDDERRSVIAEVEELQATRNAESKKIGVLMREGKRDEAEAAKEAVREVNEKIEGLAARRSELEAQLTDFMAHLPNLPYEATPVGKDETENPERRRWGTPRDFAAEGFEAKPHWDLGTDLGILDFERGAKLSGGRFTVLSGDGATLDRALESFFLNTHLAAGFREFIPPVVVNREIMYGTGQLPKFEDDAYHVGDDQFLIPTAEVVLTNLHAGEVLDAADLPLWYTAGTPCFREEAGSAGRDTRGIIRQHQFTKVEMVKFATPETSDDELESMVAEAEHILQLLELPYRVISLCTGDLGFSARQTYDIEVWLPSYNSYKEISSCSNCGDFQARRANIKYRDPEHFKGTRFVHTLNGSGLPTGRTMAAIMENYQNPDGSITIPEVLRPYMGGRERIEPRA